MYFLAYLKSGFLSYIPYILRQPSQSLRFLWSGQESILYAYNAHFRLDNLRLHCDGHIFFDQMIDWS